MRRYHVSVFYDRRSWLMRILIVAVLATLVLSETSESQSAKLQTNEPTKQPFAPASRSANTEDYEEDFAVAVPESSFQSSSFATELQSRDDYYTDMSIYEYEDSDDDEEEGDIVALPATIHFLFLAHEDGNSNSTERRPRAPNSVEIYRVIQQTENFLVNAIKQHVEPSLPAPFLWDDQNMFHFVTLEMATSEYSFASQQLTLLLHVLFQRFAVNDDENDDNSIKQYLTEQVRALIPEDHLRLYLVEHLDSMFTNSSARDSLRFEIKE